MCAVSNTAPARNGDIGVVVVVVFVVVVVAVAVAAAASSKRKTRMNNWIWCKNFYSALQETGYEF